MPILSILLSSDAASHASSVSIENDLLVLFLVIFSIIMVAFFASSEAAILSVNPIRVQKLAENGDRRAITLLKLRGDHDKLFATILAVENMFIIFGSGIGHASLERSFHDIHIPLLLIPLLATCVLEFFIVLFGEITPKTFAAQHSLRFALMMSRPINIVMIVVYPIIKFVFVVPSKGLIYLLEKIMGQGEHMPSITEEELRMMIDKSSKEGVLEQDERELLQNVFEFGDTVVSEIMTIRANVLAFQIDTSINEALPEMLESGYSQYPIYGDSIDDIRGIVFIKDIFKYRINETPNDTDTLEKLCRATIFVPENKKIDSLLEMMQKHKTKAAIVADEYGGTEGLVTITDILSEIVGDMEDEYSPIETFIFQIAQDKYLIQGVTSIYDVNQKIGIELPEGNYQTIAGFILEQLGQIPNAGELVQFNGLELKVTQMMGPKILEVQLTNSV